MDNSIENIVIELISEQFEIPISEIDLNSRLIQDFDMSAMDYAELIMDLEDEFDIFISDANMSNCKTVYDIIYLINNLKNPIIIDHDENCTITLPLNTDRPCDGICTCGAGWNELKKHLDNRSIKLSQIDYLVSDEIKKLLAHSKISFSKRLGLFERIKNKLKSFL